MDRNLIIALVISMAFFVLYDSFILQPRRDAFEEAQQAQAQAAEQAAAQGTADAGANDPASLLAGGTDEVSRAEALDRAPGRVPFDTPEIDGSINLKGLLIDDLKLKQYRIDPKDEAAEVVLLSPVSAPHAQYMRAGTLIDGQSDAQVVWEAPEGAILTPDSPVTFTRTQDGIEHAVTISVDNHFMFRVEQTLRNETDEDVPLQGYGASYQKGIPPDLIGGAVFEGPMSVIGTNLKDRKYKTLLKKGPIRETGIGGYVGITDKYWLSAAIPPQDMPFRADLTASETATPLFRASYLLDPVTLHAGAEYTTTSYLFGGAKEVALLRSYEKELGLKRFDWAVDWGFLSFLTRPIFNTLSFFHGLVGNWGVAILLLTLVIKAILFPLANMSYKSMAGMKKVQPELKKLQERYKDDKMKQQQEMMALYKKYKINPAAGCLPILAQMPIFFALYKTLYVTIELRHEPFLYISDLSSRDPTSIFNLFGLLPYDPLSVPMIGTFLGLGILPLLMGAAMFVQTKLNPPPPDPTQRQIFALMPLIFMFVFSGFAAGLVLYWFWNTFLSLIQQYIIMKRQGAEVDIIGNIKQTFHFKHDDEKAPANENKPD